jgi:type IV secretion system protein VirB1
MGVIAMLVPFALSALLERCAPKVGPVTMSAIIVHESGGRPNAIGDNTTRRSYDPADRAAATRLANRLLASGHNIDVGYAQINSSNFGAYGLSAATAFDQCTNVAVGGRILRGDYVVAARTYGAGQMALVHALSAYNTGGYWSGLGYARAVYATAAHLHYRRGRPSSPGAPHRAVAFRPQSARTP